MQVLSNPELPELLDGLVANEVPERRGLDAWAAFLRAHASLVRQLETDLKNETDLALADFDVLAQLARAGGKLRMTELADRALISRSGMTRRIASLVGQGLVARTVTETDARGVLVSLTDAGVERLTETAPIHARGVAKLFVAQLDGEELAALKSALEKVTLDCKFG